MYATLLFLPRTGARPAFREELPRGRKAERECCAAETRGWRSALTGDDEGGQPRPPPLPHSRCPLEPRFSHLAERLAGSPAAGLGVPGR